MDTTLLPSTASTAASSPASDDGKRCALNLTLATFIIAVAGFAGTAFATALV